MEIEVQVDVHTVHPVSAPPGPIKNVACGPKASWATPEKTPHAPLVHTNSYVESRREDNAQIREKSILPVRKVRLYPESPPSEIGFQAENKKSNAKLPEWEKQLRNSLKRSSMDSVRPLPIMEAPQSPIPSPTRNKNCEGFQLPSFFDPLAPIDPQGRMYIAWLMLVTLCYMYNAISVPLRASFPYQTPENTPIWMVMDYICDLIYLLDVLLVKPRLMFLHEGFWVADPRETRKNYKNQLQYKFDVIALLPLDLLYFYFGTSKVILRFPRLLKLQTFWEFNQSMDRMLASPYVVRIGKILCYIIYLIHLNACAYYAMSAHIGLASNGWVYNDEGHAYIRCFYFATKTATSIGKNPKPETIKEYMFMTASWLMGVFVFAVLIGQVRDIYSTATRAQTEYRKTVDGCSQYLRGLNMPAALQHRVMCWYRYTWHQHRCFDESKILDSLPSNMKRDVALAVHMNTLSKVQLFRDCSDTLLRDLVLQLRAVSFLPGDPVVRRGDVGHHMYIVKSGECLVMSHNETEVLATLREGSVFGEISLLGIDGLRRRTATVRSRGYSTLFALSRYDLDQALQHHKEAAQILRLRADQIIRENAARQVQQRAEEKRTVRRRSASSNSSAVNDERRLRSISAMSKRKLSSVSENKVQSARVQKCNVSMSSIHSGSGSHIPSIMYSNEKND